MSHMSELHDDLGTIHRILLGQRLLLTKQREGAYMGGHNDLYHWDSKIEVIDNLLLEIEAAGIKWPTNVVEGDFTKVWPKEL